MICVSLAGISFDECVKALEKFEFVEIRIDLLDLSDKQFSYLFANKRKTIATCRPGKHNEVRRIQLLKMAIEHGAGYVDIEYEANSAYRDDLLNFARLHNTMSIISYHNFEATPSKIELEEIINQSFKWGANRVKIATMAKNKADSARVLGLYENHTNLIAFCMGAIGKITRIAAPLLGSDFTFAALNDKLATAPGQLTVEECIKILN